MRKVCRTFAEGRKKVDTPSAPKRHQNATRGTFPAEGVPQKSTPSANTQQTFRKRVAVITFSVIPGYLSSPTVPIVPLFVPLGSVHGDLLPVIPDLIGDLIQHESFRTRAESLTKHFWKSENIYENHFWKSEIFMKNPFGKVFSFISFPLPAPNGNLTGLRP